MRHVPRAPGQSGSLAVIECTAARTVTPQMPAPLRRLSEAMGRRRSKPVAMFLVHEAPKAGGELRAVAPGVRALPPGRRSSTSYDHAHDAHHRRRCGRAVDDRGFHRKLKNVEANTSDGD